MLSIELRSITSKSLPQKTFFSLLYCHIHLVKSSISVLKCECRDLHGPGRDGIFLIYNLEARHIFITPPKKVPKIVGAGLFGNRKKEK